MYAIRSYYDRYVQELCRLFFGFYRVIVQAFSYAFESHQLAYRHEFEVVFCSVKWGYRQRAVHVCGKKVYAAACKYSFLGNPVAGKAVEYIVFLPPLSYNFV